MKKKNKKKEVSKWWDVIAVSSLFIGVLFSFIAGLSTKEDSIFIIWMLPAIFFVMEGIFILFSKTETGNNDIGWLGCKFSALVIGIFATLCIAGTTYIFSSGDYKKAANWIAGHYLWFLIPVGIVGFFVVNYFVYKHLTKK